MSITSVAILEVATRIGTPLIKKFLTARFGKTAGGVGEKIAEGLTEAVNKRIESSSGSSTENQVIHSHDIEDAIKYVEENEATDIIEYQIKSQEVANELMIAEMNKGPLWTWAWRPATMYLLGFFWIWTIIVAPICNSRMDADLITIGFDDLITLTGIYMMLYMGGHTLKSIVKPK